MISEENFKNTPMRYPHEQPPMKYPVYILSKGRYDKCITMQTLDKMGIPYRVVAETHEYDLYVKALGKEKVIMLPFSNHGKGSGVARNFCWEHSISEGHERHWLMDDNIWDFYYLNKNRKNRIYSNILFRSIEDFVDRYENVALAAPQYQFFAAAGCKMRPIVLNTRVMSCILIKNDIPIRWRAKYNEDVDISIRAMKAGYPIMLFNHFLQDKATTGTVTGGNTEELYGNGTFDKSKMLTILHPDCVRMVERYDRCHHHADLRAFKNILPIKKSNYKELVEEQKEKFKMRLIDER